MAANRVHYSEVLDRFKHIDAEFVGFEIDPPESEAHLRVRFYPWWEHPDFVAAKESGRPWGFTDEAKDAAVVVTVTAKNFVRAALGAPQYVIDWSFHETHPLLLP